MSSLVGVAISAALMPPAVNASLMVVLGLLTGSLVGVTIGVNSFLLLAMNIVLIDIAAIIIMFRVKRLTVIADKSATWTAVTQFRHTRSRSLYHVTTDEQGEAKPASADAATFTPAPAAAPSEPTRPGPPPDEDASSESS